MERFPIELLAFGALLLVILLFNYAARRAARQSPQPQDDVPQYSKYEASPQRQPYARDESPAEFWGVHPPAVATPLAPAPVDRVERPRPLEPPRLRRTRYTRRSLLGSKRDLRRAVVLMTVLGPCRAAER